MTNLTDKQLADFRLRCLRAKARDYKIARMDHYLNLLAEETGIKEPLKGIRTGSLDHLLTLIEVARSKREGSEVSVETLPKTEPPPPLEEDSVEELAEDPVEGLSFKSYYEMTRDELYEEAQALNIYGRSKMSYEELLEAVQRQVSSEEDE